MKVMQLCNCIHLCHRSIDMQVRTDLGHLRRWPRGAGTAPRPCADQTMTDARYDRASPDLNNGEGSTTEGEQTQPDDGGLARRTLLGTAATLAGLTASPSAVSANTDHTAGAAPEQPAVALSYALKGTDDDGALTVTSNTYHPEGGPKWEAEISYRSEPFWVDIALDRRAVKDFITALGVETEREIGGKTRHSFGDAYHYSTVVLTETPGGRRQISVITDGADAQIQLAEGETDRVQEELRAALEDPATPNSGMFP